MKTFSVSSLHHLYLSILAGALTLTLSCIANAQSVQKITDGSTPLAVSSGAPLGAYSLSDLDSVNLYNGSLNFRLPLVKISGRGGAGYEMIMRIEHKWLVHKEQQLGVPNRYVPDANWWNPESFNVIYSVGRLDMRKAVNNDQPDVHCGAYIYHETLTRLTFTAPDGTEYELRDQLTNGRPDHPTCTTGFNRGKVFTTNDGSSATFISDSDISDEPGGSLGESYPSGYMVLRDGTRYRIDSALVTWMRDRNGNKVTFGYDSFQRLSTVTDSLNRKVTIAYASDSIPYDQVTLKGFGGAPRTIKVYQTALQNALRSDFSYQTYQQLFPELNGAVSGLGPLPVVSAVELPNGQQYHFYYNSFAELARVVLPTGGAIEYDYAAGLTDGAASGVINVNSPYPGKEIYRRVVERRVYPDGGTGPSYASRLTYSKPESSTSNAGYVVADQYNSSGSWLGHSVHYFYGSPRASFSQQPTQYSGWKDGREYQTTIYAADGVTPLRQVTSTFAQRAPVSWWTGSADQEPPNDPRQVETVTTLMDTNQVTKQSSINPYDSNDKGFDQFNNQTDTWEYDYGIGAPGALIRHTHTNFLSATNYTDAVNGGSLLSLPVQTSVYDAGGIERGRTSFEYDNYNTDTNHANLQTYPRPGFSELPISGLDTAFNSSSNNLTRGNVTAATHYLLNDSGSPIGSFSTYAQYDIAGNAIKAIDARGYATTLDYSDRFGAPNGEAQANAPPAELSSQGQSSYAFPTLVTNALGQTTYVQLDYYLGRTVDGQDANGIVSSAYFNDDLDRPKLMIRAVNGGVDVKSQTTINYDDLNHLVTTTSDQSNYGDNLLKSEMVYDNLGRTTEKRQYETASSFIAVRQTYDVLGRNSQTSNPFRSGEAILWTTTAYDDLGRVISVTTPDNAAVKTSYSGNRVLVADQNQTDQLRRKRISQTDGLGRLKDVWEVTSADGATDPVSFPGWPDVTAGYHTSYEYDTLDDLTSVHQGIQMPRSFVYDSLKRLTSAMNPESGTVGYQYDENGNLKVKTDARGSSAHITYDALNRVTRRWYNGSSSPAEQANNVPALPIGVTTTDEVAYFYDSQGLPSGAPPSLARGYATGRLVAVTYGTGSSAGDYYSYDATGREVSRFQQTSGVNNQVRAVYNLANAVTSLIYPTGNHVDYDYDRAGRANSMIGTLADGRSRTYATGITYSPFGGLAQEQFGTQTSLYHKLHYNIRGQQYDIAVSTSSLQTNEFNWNRGHLALYYGYEFGQSGPANNGNITRAQHWIPTNDAISDYSYTEATYNYDALNRLSSTSEFQAGWDWLTRPSYAQNYDYDRWGNRTINPSSSSVINHAQFDKSDAQNSNRLYAPGDTALPMNQRQMQYDAAGNLTQDSYTGQGTRLYDAENRMTGAQDLNQSWSYYTYDGDGRRVRRTINGVETRQVYGMNGELLLESASNTFPAWMPKEYGYRNGQLLIIATAQSNLPASSRSSGQAQTDASVTVAQGKPQLNPSQELLARINRIELPGWLEDRLSGRSNTLAVSDTSTPLFGSAFPYASLNRTALPLMPQSGSAKIAFASNRDGSAQIYSMNTDGSGLSRLTNDAANDESPNWSPNNSRIVFQSDRDNLFSGIADIYVMNWDGSGQTRLTSDPADDSAPVWSPDGTRIAFQSARNGVNYQVYVMNVDGSGQINISNSTANDTQPSWSPDGSKIAFASDRDQVGFSSIYVMNANGTNQTRLTVSSSGRLDQQPAWSPDGSRLTFTSTRDSITVTWQETDDNGGIVTKSALQVNKEVYVMNANGSTQARLTNTLENDDSASWSGDGTKIVFRSDRERDCCDPTGQVWLMNPDGTSQVDLSNNGSVDHCPNWQHVSTNMPPSVSITSPATGASFTALAAITITASASDSDGSVSRVDFYSGTSLIGTATSAPYTINWNNVGGGSYSLTARATDNLGATTISNAVNVTVNAPPAVSITSPVNGASFTAPGNITITANATDSDGSISRVDFYQGTILIGSATSSPYTMSWNNVAAGSYSLTARATDNLGATITSTAVSISVTPAGSCSGPTSGLVACWKFDENGGTTAADSSGYGHQGTLQNGTSWTTGQSAAALNFDGVDDMVVTNGLADVTNNFTLSFWALPSASHEIDSESTGGTSGTSGERYAFWPTWYDGGHAGAGVSVGTNGVSVYEHAAYYMPATLVYPATITNWTHITIVYENKQPKLYINGTLVRTGLTSTMDYVHLNPYYIGGQVYGYYAGRMDEVRIYNRALSASEVSVLANGPPVPNASAFVSQTVPTTMTAGQNYAVSVAMQNTGSNTWTTATNHNLGSQNAQDNTTWGMARVPLPSSVATGTTVTYNFTVTAPWTPGTYNFQWRMVQDGVEWFGDFSPNVVVTVGSSNSEYHLYTADVRWIVSDQLGTPRMIFDQSGSLANVSRHDYLPFGEELANVGGRTTARGYTGNDGARQKFTQKERDNETGLDYFLARYYSSTQGRFTSPDEFSGGPDELYDFADDASDNPTFYADTSEPQSLNKYQYTYNNPLNMTDDDGHCPVCVVVIVVVTVEILTAPDTVNAPGPRDRVYPSGDGVKTLFGNVAAGVVGGAVLSKFGGPIVRSALGRLGGREGTEIVERAMSKAELRATRETSLVRGGREGVHHVTNSVSKSATKAQQRLGLESKPEVAAQLKVPKGQFSAPTRVKAVDHPKGGVLPGGGLERTATGNVPAKVIRVRTLIKD
jgi:RHS repeat-associated protein